MSIQTPRSGLTIYSLLLSRVFYCFIWLILLFFLLTEWTLRPAYFLFGISAILVFTHIFYGGHFLFNKENRIDGIVFLLTALIYFGLVGLVIQVNNLLLWFLCLQLVFLFAICLHFYYKRRVVGVYLKEFCNYKAYIEITGIIFNVLGMIFYLKFPRLTSLLGVLALFSIIKFNLLIFRSKRLYDVVYQPPDVGDNPLVSIVIIAYNEEDYIGKLLDSIRDQSYKRFEVILVDDHSTDKTQEIARNYESSLPLKIVQKEIRGASRSRNYGATFAKGEIILFLDADVVLAPDFILKNLETFKDERLSIAAIDFIPITANFADKRIVGFYRFWLKTVQYFNPRGIGFCLFVHRDVHEQVLFDEGVLISEDFDYVKRAVRRGKFRIIDTVALSVSWRRFDRENRFLLVLKYLFFEWHRQNIGEIRKKLLPYDFGKQ